MKQRAVAVACFAILGAGLTGCGGGGEKAALPSQTAGSGPSTTVATRSATPTATPLPKGAASGPVDLAAHSTYTYGGLKFVVNLPADIPRASRPSMRLFSKFLQSDGRSTASDKLDPAMSALASVNVVKEANESAGGETTLGIGSVIYTISRVGTVKDGPTVITGCLDQSKLVQVRKNGARYVDANTKKFPKLKVTATVSREQSGLKVTYLRFADEAC